jgi:hypothetical protein
MTKITDLYTKEDDIYTCKMCKKTSTHASTMHYHIANTHIEEKPFNCAHCKKGFTQKGLYMKHLAHKHPDTTQSITKNPYTGVYYHCGGCDHTSTTKGNCLIHYTRTHALWVPAYSSTAACTGCTKLFTSSTAYLHHALYCFPLPGKKEEKEIIETIEARTAPPTLRPL